ncbi:hypothetical protein BV898_03811 [Hypsibius exemplaris]|uniref:Uncharacterized protein n=1 Tax=Hypsibius exemplaris TaxID=2072580 RepID=A0A1W0X4J5_HYPEX|nr:hypothetical protein BV898_03811 [Hypsibius exemplaris]
MRRFSVLRVATTTERRIRRFYNFLTCFSVTPPPSPNCSGYCFNGETILNKPHLGWRNAFNSVHHSSHPAHSSSQQPVVRPHLHHHCSVKAALRVKVKVPMDSAAADRSSLWTLSR